MIIQCNLIIYIYIYIGVYIYIYTWACQANAKDRKTSQKMMKDDKRWRTFSPIE